MIDENVEWILNTNADDLLVNLVTFFWRLPADVKRKIGMGIYTTTGNGLVQRLYNINHNNRIEYYVVVRISILLFWSFFTLD